MAALIEIDRIRKSFDGGKSFAVCDVTMNVDAGLFVALVGASGSGKTTTLKMINRLMEPDGGTVRIGGEPVDVLDAATLRRSIGYVFQGIGLFPHMTIGENIGITPLLLGWPQARIAARVAELLDLMSLPQNYAGRLPEALSGGERQRAAIARAIAARPQIVLMDEPFGALDPVTRDTLGPAYRAMHDELALTTIMVTHDMQDAVLLADRIVVMRAGRVLAQDTPRALLSNPSDPDVAALMAMPRRRAERIRTMMEAEAGASPHG